MPLDPSPTPHDFVPTPSPGGMGAPADAQIVPPPLPPIAAVPEVRAASVPPVEAPPTAEPRGRWARLVASAAARFLAWYRDDGFWYLTSMAAHAVGLFALAVISIALPRAIGLTGDAPAFEAVAVEPKLPEIQHFELGKPLLDPSDLSPDRAGEMKALSVGGPVEKHFDDSPDFEDAGGGTPIDSDAPKLGGLGGFSIKYLPGPGGRGGVGVGVGTGRGPGSGGDAAGFGGRGRGHLEQGATRASERSVFAALNWIARHQTSYGRWSLDFRRQCKSPTCTGPGSVQADVAATSMAILPFLGAGQTHKSKGIYQRTIDRGLTWLVKQQRADGGLYGEAAQPMYSHALATLTLCEAYGMTKDEHLGGAARRAVAFIEAAQNRETGGWRYQPGDPGDTSVFGWQIMALKSAKMAGIYVHDQTFEKAAKWLDSVAKGPYQGLYCYQPYREVTPTMTAVGMLGRQYLGADPRSASLRESKQCMLENLPSYAADRNVYYWYYATLGMHNFADAEWDTWNRKIRRVLIESQDRRSCAEGSWDPEHPTLDAWGTSGGRLMMTSLSALTLEVYYRYMPLFQTDSPVEGAVNMGFQKTTEAKSK